MGTDTHPGDRGGNNNFEHYWVHGAGAAKIGWGVPGDFLRCVAALAPYFPQDPKGLCSNYHVKALGVRPGMEGGGSGNKGHASPVSKGDSPAR
jgi:hypothetical protein